MEKEKIRISPKLISILAAGVILVTPVTGMAVTNNSYDEGTFVKWIEQTDAYDYGIYIVKEKDNWSRISEKVCSHQRVDITTKYWPALLVYNNSPTVIRPGDIVYFPKNHEDLVELYEKLDKSGKISEIKQKRKVYGPKRKKVSMEALGALLYDIYGEKLGCIDPDMMNTYLKVTGLDKKYELRSTTNELTGDEFVDFTIYIPSVEEINNYQEAQKVKVKK